MKKRYMIVAIASILLLVIVPVAMAFEGPPIGDAWVDTSGTTNRGTAVKLQNQSSNVAACGPDWRSYLKWDISSIMTEPVPDKQIGTGTIDLTVRLTDVTAGGVTISVYQAANSTWTETGITGANQPGTTGAALSSYTFSAAPVVGTTYTIPSSPALVQYLNTVNPANGGNGIVSLVVYISGCPLGTSRIDFDSREGTVAPRLNLRNPTAVSLSTASAQRSTAWPLYAGLGAVALFVVAGVVISRRRTA